MANISSAKVENCQLRILSPAKIYFRNKEKIKIFSDEEKIRVYFHQEGTKNNTKKKYMCKYNKLSFSYFVF